MDVLESHSFPETFSADSLIEVFDHHGWKVEQFDEEWSEPVSDPGTPQPRSLASTSKSRGFPLLIGVSYYKK